VFTYIHTLYMCVCVCVCVRARVGWVGVRACVCVCKMYVCTYTYLNMHMCVRTHTQSNLRKNNFGHIACKIHGWNEKTILDQRKWSSRWSILCHQFEHNDVIVNSSVSVKVIVRKKICNLIVSKSINHNRNCGLRRRRTEERSTVIG